MASKTFDPQYWDLETLCKQIYNVPVYQRPYSWDIEQVQVLLDDLLEAYNSEDKYGGYFIGNLIVHDKNEKINGNILKFEIVDGQQRITTFALILLSIYTLSSVRKYNSTDQTIQTVKQSLWKYVERKFVKELRTVNLNSIEKETFEKLYDYCFDAESEGFNIDEYCKNYNCITKFDKRVILNFKFIYDFFDKKFNTPDELLNFADYVLRYAQFIVIQSTSAQKKVFSMFESINSKGKKLDEIDLIKTYIFSNLEEADYQHYLDIWGNLIIQTSDDLYDYFYNFIKAYICFYRQNITSYYFKSLSRRELLAFYKCSSLPKALKMFLDDLNSKVKYYKMLSSINEVYKLLPNNRLRYFYKLFVDIKYQHPKALFLRTLIEYDEHVIEKKEDAVAIIVETIKFMVKFLTIGNGDSKDAITMFSSIMNDIYAEGHVTREIVEYAIASEIIKKGITSDKLKLDLASFDAYEQNKKLTIALLSLYDSVTVDEKGKKKYSFDQAYLIMKNYTDAFSLDHLLVQTPDSDSTDFKYYKDENNNRLVLKDGNDFPQEIVQSGMDYDMFTSTILNKIGNLRIYYKDKNSGRQNTAISLAEYDNFNTYKQIKERGTDIAQTIIDEIFIAPNVDLSKRPAVSLTKEEEALPKMAKLIEYGLIHVGDQLYITLFPDSSVATLLDDKKVNFNGKEMSINDWGCSVTKWKSIRIYAYCAKVGEIETLHQKRLKFIAEHNEAPTSDE